MSGRNSCQNGFVKSMLFFLELIERLVRLGVKQISMLSAIFTIVNLLNVFLQSSILFVVITLFERILKELIYIDGFRPERISSVPNFFHFLAVFGKNDQVTGCCSSGK